MMEIEIKLTGASEAHFRSVGDELGPYRLGPARRKQILDVYYDTPSRDLLRRGIALRRRDENGAAFYTLKERDSFAGGVARREEVEVEATPANWQMLLHRAGAPEEPVPLLTIRTERRKRDVIRDGAMVAVAAFDRVDYGAGRIYYDVEFELAEGAAEEHLHSLAAFFPDLTPSVEDKLQRGLRVTGI